MGNLKNTFLKLFREQKGLFIMMVVNFLFGLFVFIYTLVAIDPTSAVVRVGYGDIGGYKDGVWTNMFAFPILAVVFGTVHNFLAVKVFQRRGDGMAKVIVAISMMLLIGTLVVFLRLLGES